MTHVNAINSAIETLEKNAKTFRWYEEMHRAKPDHEKADRNAEFARQTEQALTALRALRNAVPEIKRGRTTPPTFEDLKKDIHDMDTCAKLLTEATGSG